MATIHERTLRSGEVVWELTHGTGSDRQRFVVGKTREEAQEVLNQFNRQLALHGEAPSDDSVEAVIGEYAQYLKTNRRPNTVDRYLQVIRTFHDCYLTPFAPEVRRLRQLRPVHLEEYKRRRADGEIGEQPRTSEDLAREDSLRAELATRGKIESRKANAKFGWLGRHRVKRRPSLRTVNYELRVLFTFFAWA
ncbi:hypothetical protein HYS30_03970, partial [Candidatus Peregrinibacteria bacterium]|nr:hypothetical protein [Candidatus Peregrinibacteria bacterium]